MRKKILYASAFVFISWAATSCEGIEKCKYCRLVETDLITGDVTEGFETEYCGAALIAIEAKGSYITGTTKAEWVCR